MKTEGLQVLAAEAETREAVIGKLTVVFVCMKSVEFWDISLEIPKTEASRGQLSLRQGTCLNLILDMKSVLKN